MTRSPHGIGRVVYLSGLVPDVPGPELSPHIASRLEVERILLQSTAATLSLRAGVVIGAGLDLVRDRPADGLDPAGAAGAAVDALAGPADRGRADVIRALADALEGEAVGDADLGGPDVVTYPELLAMYAEVGAPVPRAGAGARRSRSRRCR